MQISTFEIEAKIRVYEGSLKKWRYICVGRASDKVIKRHFVEQSEIQLGRRYFLINVSKFYEQINENTLGTTYSMP